MVIEPVSRISRADLDQGLYFPTYRMLRLSPESTRQQPGLCIHLS